MRCHKCEKEFRESKYQRYKHKKGKNVFCSKQCFWLWISNKYMGKNNPFYGKVRTEKEKDAIRKVTFKTGKSKNKQGYIVLHSNSKRTATTEHRHLFEKHTGRKLNKNEVVHHKNEIKNDNRIENLMLMTKSQHTKFHNDERG